MVKLKTIRSATASMLRFDLRQLMLLVLVIGVLAAVLSLAAGADPMIPGTAPGWRETALDAARRQSPDIVKLIEDSLTRRK